MIISILLGGAVACACVAVRWQLDRPERQDSEHFGGIVKLTGLRNCGSAFGLLRLTAKQLSVLSAGLLAWSLTLWRESRIGCALVLGGGLSNLWERVMHGSVYDYLQFPKAPKKLQQYVFNLADLAILAGVIAMALGGRKKK